VNGEELGGYEYADDGGEACKEVGGDGKVGLRVGTGEICGSGAFAALSQ
jgi:hypothetical protein